MSTKESQKKFDKEMKAYVKTLVNESSQEDTMTAKPMSDEELKRQFWDSPTMVSLPVISMPKINKALDALIVSAKASGRREVLMDIDSEINHRLNQEKNNSIFNKSPDELNDEFIWDLERIKQKFQKEA